MKFNEIQWNPMKSWIVPSIENCRKVVNGNLFVSGNDYFFAASQIFN